MKKIIVLFLFIWLFVPSLCLGIDTINENSSAVLRLTWKDADSVLTIPTSFKCRIDDLSSGTVIRAITEILPLASSYDLTITSSENRIIASARSYEQRKVTIQWYVGSTLVGTADYKYKVINLKHVPFP